MGKNKAKNKNKLNKMLPQSENGGVGDPSQHLNLKPSAPPFYKTFEKEKSKQTIVHREPPFLIQFCQAILSNLELRINLYLIGGLALSLLSPYVQEYQEYIFTAQPGNFLNTFLVKWGWGWTLCLVLPFKIIIGIINIKIFSIFKIFQILKC